jgi:hypothetical protein
MIHGRFIRIRRHPVSPLASAWRALCRLPAPGAWLLLVRPGAIEATPALGLVLLDGLPGFMDAISAGAFGHG